MSVDTDLACAGCGYNLRTLPPTGQCPECDRPVIESVEHHRALVALLPALRRVAMGAHLVIAYVAMNVVVWTLDVLVVTRVVDLGSTWMTGRILRNAAGASLLTGVWLVTTTKGTAAPRLAKLRWFIRGWAMTFMLARLSDSPIMSRPSIALPGWIGWALLLLIPLGCAFLLNRFDRLSAFEWRTLRQVVTAAILTFIVAVIVARVFVSWWWRESRAYLLQSTLYGSGLAAFLIYIRFFTVSLKCPRIGRQLVILALTVASLGIGWTLLGAFAAATSLGRSSGVLISLQIVVSILGITTVVATVWCSTLLVQLGHRARLAAKLQPSAVLAE